MQVLIQVLLVIGLVLGVITVVGHGLWVLLAAIFGGAPRQTDDQGVCVCVFCGRTISRGEPRCGWCGRDLCSKLAREFATCKQSIASCNVGGDLGGCRRRRLRNCARVQRDHQELLHPAAKQPVVAHPVAAQEVVHALESPQTPAASPAIIVAEAVAADAGMPAGGPIVAARAVTPQEPVIASWRQHRKRRPRNRPERCQARTMRPRRHRRDPGAKCSPASWKSGTSAGAS